MLSLLKPERPLDFGSLDVALTSETQLCIDFQLNGSMRSSFVDYGLEL